MTNRVILAKIADVHGIKGLVKIFPYGEDITLLESIESVYAQNTPIKITLKNALGKFILAEIEGVQSREDAEKYKGQELSVDKDALPALNVRSERPTQAPVVRHPVHPLHHPPEPWPPPQLRTDTSAPNARTMFRRTELAPLPQLPIHRMTDPSARHPRSGRARPHLYVSDRQGHRPRTGHRSAPGKA